MVTELRRRHDYSGAEPPASGTSIKLAGLGPVSDGSVGSGVGLPGGVLSIYMHRMRFRALVWFFMYSLERFGLLIHLSIYFNPHPPFGAGTTAGVARAVSRRSACQVRQRCQASDVRLLTLMRRLPQRFWNLRMSTGGDTWW